jgi:hypothetical protein
MVMLVQPVKDGWSALDWQEFYEDCVKFNEREGSGSRDQAKADAYRFLADTCLDLISSTSLNGLWADGGGGEQPNDAWWLDEVADWLSLVRWRQAEAADGLSAKLDLEPPISSDRVCIHCGGGEQPKDALRPLSVVPWLHDGCRPPQLQARQLATDARSAKMDVDPDISPDRVCIYCCVGEQPNDPLRAYGVPTWIHDGCRPTWFRARQAVAMAALAARGIHLPADTEPKSAATEVPT